jgi:exopolysaccharide biosynthesis predicted pyruvyltransferase EpsI
VTLPVDQAHGDSDLLRDLSGTIDAQFSELLQPGSEVAFVNYPNLRNVGDVAIWLGTRAALERASVRVRYLAEPATYRRRLLTSAVGEGGTILIQGGGNLGDVYPHQHRVRKQVLRDFPNARVIQLPQSVWFRTPKHTQRFRRLAEGHSDFTLMVRERRSLEWAEEKLNVRVELCPDLAFGLDPIRRISPDLDLLWLMRKDSESRDESLPALGPDEERADWRGRDVLRPAEGHALRLALAANRRLGTAMDANGRLAAGLWRAQAATYGPIAERRVDSAARLLSRGRFVITDRLHGHVLAMLLGIPHAVLDNESGKSRALWETWTSGSTLAHWTTDPVAAQTHARAVLVGGEQR